MATSEYRRAKAAIWKWASKHLWIVRPGSPIRGVRHVHPRAYIIAKPAPKCIVVAKPWMDSEPQVREIDRLHGTDIIHDFDESLKAGDWCATGYVSTPTSGWTCAIALPLAAKSKPKRQHPRSRTPA